MHTPQDKTPFYEILKNYLPGIIIVGGAFSSIVLFWNDAREVKKDVDTNKVEIDSKIQVLEDKVNRQYATQREMNDKTNKEVDALKLWVEYEKGRQSGYKQAMSELNIKR